MSTRSNIIIVTPDNKVHQYYHHCDGYLEGVGEELRKALVYSIGLHTINENSKIYDSLRHTLSQDDEYEDEYIMELDDHNCLHGDVEFIYVIKDATLYYVEEYDTCHLIKTNKDLIHHVCKDCNIISLTKPL